MKRLFGCYCLWIKHTNSLHKWNVIELCLESAAVDTSSHSQSRFGVSFGCFSSTAAHRVVMLTCRNPGPVSWLPPPHCFSLCCPVWAGEYKQVKSLRLSSRALPLRLPAGQKQCRKLSLVSRVSIAQQSDLRAFSRVDEPVSNTCLTNLLLTPAPLPCPHKAGQCCPAGFYQVNHADTHTTLPSRWGKAKGAKMSFQEFQPWDWELTPCKHRPLFWIAPLGSLPYDENLILPAPIFLTRANKPCSLAWGFHMLLDLPSGILNSTYTSDFNNPPFFKRKGQLVFLPCHKRCFSSMKNHSVILEAPKLSCLTPAILDECELNVWNSAVEQLSPCVYSWG